MERGKHQSFNRMSQPARRTHSPATNARAGVLEAVEACRNKKAEAISLLELEQGSGAFTDYFVICSGSNPRQVQAISDEVEDRLGRSGLRPNHVEGYTQAEWILLDYVDFVVHVFSEGARRFYGLERLWKSARRVLPEQLLSVRRRKAVLRAAQPKRAAARKPVKPRKPRKKR